MEGRGWKITASVGVLVAALAVGYALASGESTAALTLLGALIVAVLTAWAADQRLSRQLAAAAERHERELTHDREQRVAARAHDRELADLADLRAIVDDVVVALRACGPALRQIVTAAMLEHVQRQPLATIERSQRNAIAESWAGPPAKVLKALAVERARLEIRLGQEDPLAVAVAEASRAARRLVSDAVAAIRHHGVPLAERDGWKAVRAFEAAARLAEQEAVKRTGAVMFNARLNGAWDDAAERCGSVPVSAGSAE